MDDNRNLGSLLSSKQEKSDFTYVSERKGTDTKQGPSTTSSSSPKVESKSKIVYSVPSAIHLYVVDTTTNAYKYIGNLGITILCNDSNNYSIYIFKDKDTGYHTVPITSSFNYTITPSEDTAYGIFNDPDNRQWSVRFSTIEHSNQFAMNILSAMHFSRRQEVSFMDIVNGTGDGVVNGCGLHISYRGFKITSPGTVGDEIIQGSSGMFLGAAPIKALDIALQNMKLSGKRLMIVSGQKGVGFDPPFDKVSPNQTIIYLIDLNAIKDNKRSDDDDPLPTIEESNKIKHIKKVQNETSNFNDDLTFDQSQDYDIQERQEQRIVQHKKESRQRNVRDSLSGQRDQGMGYGNNNIPNQGMQGNNIQDQGMGYGNMPNQGMGYGNMPNQGMGYGGNNNMPGNNMPPYGGNMPGNNMPPYGGNMPGNMPNSGMINPYNPMLGNPNLLNPNIMFPNVLPNVMPIPPPMPPPPTYSNNNPQEHFQLLVDTKTFNASINSKLETVVTKLDTIQDKISSIPSQTQQQQDTGGIVGGISGRALLQTIQKIVVENERLSSELETKSKRCDKLNEQVNDLIAKNQQYLDDSNKYSYERNKNAQEMADDLKRQLDTARIEKDNIQIELGEKTAKLNKAARTFEQMKNKITQLLQENSTLNEENTKNQDIVKQKEQETDDAKIESMKSREKFREAERDLNNLRIDYDQLKTDFDNISTRNKKLSDQLQDKANDIQKAIDERQNFWNNEKEDLTSRLNSYKNENNELKLNEQKKLAEMERQLMDQFNVDKKKFGTHYQNQKEVWENKIKELEKKNNEYEERLSELSKNKGNIETRGNTENTAPSIDLEPILKQIVNDTFQALRKDFKFNEKYDGKDVLVTVKNIMVDKTLGAVKTFTFPKAQEKTPTSTVNTAPQENIPKQNLDKPPVNQVDIQSPKNPHKVEKDTHPQHDQNNQNIPKYTVPKETHQHNTDTDGHHEVHTPKHDQNEAQNLKNDHLPKNEIKKENLPQTNVVDDFTSSEEEATINNNTTVNTQITDSVTTAVNSQITDSVTNNTTVKNNTTVNPQITDVVKTTVNPQITDAVTNNKKTGDLDELTNVNNNIPPTQNKSKDFFDELDESDEKDNLKKDTTKVEEPIETTKTLPKVEIPKKIETNDLDSLEDSFDKPDKKVENVKDTTQNTNTQPKPKDDFDIDDDMMEFTTPTTTTNTTNTTNPSTTNQNQNNKNFDDSEDLGEIKNTTTSMKASPLSVKTNLNDLSEEDSKEKKKKEEKQKVIKKNDDLSDLSEDSKEEKPKVEVKTTTEKKNDPKIDNIFGMSDETSIYNNSNTTKATTTNNNASIVDDDDLFSGF